MHSKSEIQKVVKVFSFNSLIFNCIDSGEKCILCVVDKIRYYIFNNLIMFSTEFLSPSRVQLSWCWYESVWCWHRGEKLSRKNLVTQIYFSFRNIVIDWMFSPCKLYFVYLGTETAFLYYPGFYVPSTRLSLQTSLFTSPPAQAPLEKKNFSEWVHHKIMKLFFNLTK